MGSLARWMIALAVLGIAWRSLRYALQLPIWGDEAFVCLNFLDRGYLGLLQPLRFAQVAPVLFMWAELTVCRTLGTCELALRLLPFLAGVSSLFMFRRLLKTAGIGKLPAALAFGILCVSYYPVRHGCEIKPYASDLLISLCLLLGAVSWLQHPERHRWLIALAIFVPFALAASYPAIFVAGAVSVALLPTIVARRDWKARAFYLLYNLAMVGTFLLLYLVVGRGQFVSTGGAANPFWEMWFPPRQPWPLVCWFFSVHTGNLFAYPFGGHDGGSTATLLLCIAGVIDLARQHRRSLLLLFAVPFLLTFIAAAMRRYPYGGSARVAQHLAAIICLLAGCGAADLIAWLPRVGVAPKRSATVAFIVLAGFGIAGMARDIFKPYKTDADRQVRQIVRDIAATAGPADRVIVADPHGSIGPTSEWYLRGLGSRVRWDGDIEARDLTAPASQLWLLRFGEAGSADDYVAQVQRQAPEWILLERTPYTLQLGWTDATIEHCEVLHWVGLPEPGKASR